MRRFRVAITPIWAIFFGLFSFAPALKAETMTVFAAASLKNALDEIAADFTAQSGNDVVVAYGGSGSLARQITFGAPADIFISANQNWITWLSDQKAILPQSVTAIAANQLVLISGPEQANISLNQLPDVLGPHRRLALGFVDSVPAGQYAKAALDHLGLWQSIAPFVVQTDNVRAAYHLVDIGQAAYGIVYQSDLLLGSRVNPIESIKPDLHPAIQYVAALTGQISTAEAGAFLAFLQEESSREIFENWGFSPPFKND